MSLIIGGVYPPLRLRGRQGRGYVLAIAIILSPMTHAFTSGITSSLTPVTNKTEKHFDVNKDKQLSPYERLLLRTHELKGYPLAKKKKMLPYDFNGDLMLEPFEEQKYRERKK